MCNICISHVAVCDGGVYGAGQAGGLLGDPLVQVAVSLLSSLPFLLPSLSDPAAAACLAAHGVAAAALELPHLAAVLEDVAARPSASSEAAAASLARPLADALFPRCVHTPCSGHCP